MMPLLVMAGTGTDVGKTVCTAALLRALRQNGLAAQAVKPVQTVAPMVQTPEVRKEERSVQEPVIEPVKPAETVKNSDDLLGKDFWDDIERLFRDHN